jgi:selenocysteine lyase/cysteine desulfurase
VAVDGADESRTADVRKYEEIGTHPQAVFNAVSVAVAFHRGIGVERKAARLRYLRDRWASALLARSDRVRVPTPLGADHGGAIGLLSVDGLEPAAFSRWLMDKYRIVTTHDRAPGVFRRAHHPEHLHAGAGGRCIHRRGQPRDRRRHWLKVLSPAMALRVSRPARRSRRRLERFVEQLQHALVLVQPGVRADEAMALQRVRRDLPVVLVQFDQLLGHVHRVLEEHVVVDHAVGDQQAVRRPAAYSIGEERL